MCTVLAHSPVSANASCDIIHLPLGFHKYNCLTFLFLWYLLQKLQQPKTVHYQHKKSMADAITNKAWQYPFVHIPLNDTATLSFSKHHKLIHNTKIFSSPRHLNVLDLLYSVYHAPSLMREATSQEADHSPPPSARLTLSCQNQISGNLTVMRNSVATISLHVIGENSRWVDF